MLADAPASAALCFATGISLASATAEVMSQLATYDRAVLTLGWRDFCDIAAPFHIRRRSGEVTFHQAQERILPFILPGQPAPSFHRMGDQALPGH